MQRGMVRRVLAARWVRNTVLLGLCVLANTGLGLFELVPDGAPLFGNLDEALATAGLVWGLAVLFRSPERTAS